MREHITALVEDPSLSQSRPRQSNRPDPPIAFARAGRDQPGARKRSEEPAEIARIEPEPDAKRPHVTALGADLPEDPRLAKRMRPSQVSLVECPDVLRDDAIEPPHLVYHRSLHSLTLVRDIREIKLSRSSGERGAPIGAPPSGRLHNEVKPTALRRSESMALEAAETVVSIDGTQAVSFATEPGRYVHWHLNVDGGVATLAMDVDEQRGLRPGYAMKLNSYDLGVDIELHDAVQRLRFEHPEVGCVVITSSKDRCFSAGANIGMLAQATHAWKVNFCKFTNETRLEMEDASANSGQTDLAAVNGAAAGGGYELALACAEILLIDDGSSAVSLPELPLLAVLPATGGLTRLGHKRHVRRDLADVFVTKSEGVKAPLALQWGLVDAAVA